MRERCGESCYPYYMRFDGKLQDGHKKSKINSFVQLGISIRDLDLLTIGMVNDMFAESMNDDYKGYHEIGTQADMDAS